MTTHPYFATPRIIAAMRETCARLDQDQTILAAKHLYEVLEFIIGNGNLMDEKCQISICTFESKLLDLLTATHRSSDLEKIDYISAIIYQFL
jgi:hypothetical protein